MYYIYGNAFRPMQLPKITFWMRLRYMFLKDIKHTVFWDKFEVKQVFLFFICPSISKISGSVFGSVGKWLSGSATRPVSWSVGQWVSVLFLGHLVISGSFGPFARNSWTHDLIQDSKISMELSWQEEPGCDMLDLS